MDIFFVLSGFLITRILLAARQEDFNFAIKRFFINRILRIFPIFYLAILYCWFFLGVSSHEITANFFYVSNYYYVFNTESTPLRHTWSLAVEEQFYLIWPFICLLVPLTKLRKFFVVGTAFVVIVSVLLTAVLLTADVAKLLVLRGVMFRLLSLAAGAYLAIRIEDVTRMSILPWLACALFMAPLVQLGIRLYFGDTFASRLILLPIYTLWSVSIFLCVYLSIGTQNLIEKIFQNSLSVYVGKISYGIYLYHFILLNQFGMRDGYEDLGITISDVILSIVVVFVISSLSYRLIEEPILSLKKRFKIGKV